VAEDLLVLVGLAGVVVRSEVGEPRFGVLEQVPDDDEDGAADGAAGPGAAAASGDAAEPLAEEGVGLAGAVGGLGAEAP
jgi:hypothetical protein